MMDLHKLTIKDIRELLTSTPPTKELLRQLGEDGRSGVRNLLEQYWRAEERKKELADQWNRMTIYEQRYREQGIQLIAGVDEVGRGPLAGPVVAAAVILPNDFYLPGINDSKKLSAKQREVFYERITTEALTYSVASVDASLIDEINIYQATTRVICQAVSDLKLLPQLCLVDGLEVKHLTVTQQAIVGGDRSSITIAAASIIAKVTRDRWMTEAAKQYPEYGFERNAGYGTPDHLRAIEKYGPCPLHRKTFAGVKEWIVKIGE